MITMTAAQQALLDSTFKAVTWLFDVKDASNVYHYWSTKDLIGGPPTSTIVWDSGIFWPVGSDIGWSMTGGAPAYTFKIIDFEGITLSRPRSEFGMIGPSTVTFSILDKEHVYSASTFVGGEVLIALRINTLLDESDTLEIARWRFKIEKAEPGYGKVRLSCENFYQQYLDGDYPNTDLVRDLFPSSDTDLDDNVCIPIPFGTAYIPLRSVYITNARYYVLGNPSLTYDISKVRSPREWGLKSKWDSGSYTFTQSTKIDGDFNPQRVFQPIIADSNFDGTADACGLWRSGDHFLDMPVKFTRSDLESYDNPADVIRYVLEDFGVPVASINTASFNTAKNIFQNVSIQSGLILHLRLNDGSGLTAVDSTSYGNDGTLEGTMTDTDWVQGHEDLGLEFDGVDDLVTVPNTSPLDQVGVNNFSVAFWIKSGISILTNSTLFNKEQDASNEIYICSSTTTNKLKAVIEKGGVSVSKVWDDLNPFDQTQHHIAVTVNRLTQEMTAYMDGVESAEVPEDLSGLPANCINTGDITIGARSDGSNPFLGVIDDYRIYNRVLTPTEIAILANDTSWELYWNGAFWYKEPRETVLARLLNMCHCTLRFANTIHLEVLSKMSRKTITKADVLKGSDVSEGSFRYSSNTVKLSDSGYAAWQENDEAQDKFHKTKVPAKTTTDYLSAEVLEIPFVQNSIHAQKLASLYFQRNLLKTAKISFEGKSTLLALRPDDMITINDNDYGGSYDVLIDTIRINKDTSVSIECTKFSDDIDDWEDLSFQTVILAEDDTTNVWEPSLSGPLSSNTFGRTSYDTWGKSWLVVSSVTNAGEHTSIQAAINALPAEGGSILVKNGTYSLTNIIAIPDKNIEIIGESQAGVVIRNSDGLDGFYLHNFTNKFKLSTMTIQSRNTVIYSSMIHALSSIIPKTIGDIELDSVTINLNDIGTHNGIGDTGVLITHGSGSTVLIDSVNVNNGRRGIYIDDIAPEVKVKNCILSLQTESGLKIKDCPSFEIRNNRTEDFIYYGIYISGLFGEAIQWDTGIGWNAEAQWFTGTDTTDHGIIFGNRLMSLNDAVDGEATGVYCEGNNISIAENTISINNSRPTSEANGIYMISGVRKKVSSNEVIVTVTTTGLVRGILAEDETDGIMQGNSIKIDQKDYTTYHVGIDVVGAGERNVISNNSINEIYNNANGIGVRLGGFTAYNIGSGNITYNVGTSVEDSGANNNVVATDV